MAAQYIINDAFNGNILVAGKTNCRKTRFVQKLGINNFFRELIVDWKLIGFLISS